MPSHFLYQIKKSSLKHLSSLLNAWDITTVCPVHKYDSFRVSEWKSTNEVAKHIECTLKMAWKKFYVNVKKRLL